MPTPISVRITFTFKAPRKKDIGEPKHTRPDLDNLCKQIMDAANGVLWEDDSQVFSLFASKRWGEEPGTDLSLEKLEKSNVTTIEKKKKESGK